MEKENKVVFSFRICERQYEKLRRIAEKNRRSINSQLEIFALDGIATHEKTNGEIDVGVLFDD